jgi:RimJ/RimL family protein N-acetyltransferase
VLIRSIDSKDVSQIGPWYEEAARASYEERPLEELRRETGKCGLFAITQPEADEPIGLVEYRLEGKWLTAAFIALAKAYRGWGYGSEAVRLLEEWAVREGLAERFRAEVDLRNGLGLYFWLRLGYRPAEWHREGGRDSMAMIRESERPTAHER